MTKQRNDVSSSGMFLIRRLDDSDTLDWLRLATLHCVSYIEEWPNTDRVDRAVRAARLQRAGIPPGGAIWLAVDCHNHESAGMVRVTPRGREDASIVLYVSPWARGNGLGRSLLRAAIQFVRRIEIGLVVSWTRSSIPRGDNFADLFQGHVTNREWSMQTERTGLDLVALRKWKSAAENNRFEVDIVCNPDSGHAESLLELRMTISATYGFEPRLTDLKRQIHSASAAMRRDGIEHWVLRAFSTATGAVVGYTDANWDPSQPKVCNHTSIAVLPPYRSRGIAMSMKAALVDTLLNEKPTLRWIRGVNSSTADRMIRRNQELGYAAHHERKRWHFATDSLAKVILC